MSITKAIAIGSLVAAVLAFIYTALYIESVRVAHTPPRIPEWSRSPGGNPPRF